MAGMINDLLEVLNMQAQTYEELYGLSQEKKDAIVKDEIDELQKITNLENILLTQHQRTEKKRVQLMEDIASVLGSKEKDIDLGSLAELMEGQDEQAGINQVRARIREALGKLALVNELNTSLIGSALEYIEYSINVMQSSVNQELATYSVQGGKLKEDGDLFDIRN